MPDYPIAPAPQKPLNLQDVYGVLNAHRDQNFGHLAVTTNDRGQQRLVAREGARPGGQDVKPAADLLAAAYKEAVGVAPNAEVRAFIENGLAGVRPDGSPISVHEFETELRFMANRQLAQNLMPGASPETLDTAARAYTNLGLVPTQENLAFVAELIECGPEQAADLVVAELTAKVQGPDGQPVNQQSGQVNDKAKLAGLVVAQRKDLPPEVAQQIGGQLYAHQASNIVAQNTNAFMRDLNPASAFSGAYLANGPASDLIDEAIREGYQAGNDAKSRGAAIAKVAAQKMPQHPEVQTYLGSVSKSTAQQLKAQGLDDESVEKLSNLSQTDAFALRALNPGIVSHSVGPKQDMVAASASCQLAANFSKPLTNDPSGQLSEARDELTDAYTQNIQQGQEYPLPANDVQTVAAKKGIGAQPEVAMSRTQSIRDALRSAKEHLKSALHLDDEHKKSRAEKQLAKRERHLADLVQRRADIAVQLDRPEVQKALERKPDPMAFVSGGGTARENQQELMDAQDLQRQTAKLDERIHRNTQKITDKRREIQRLQTKIDLRQNLQQGRAIQPAGSNRVG